jgi:hypothetical protein
MNQKAIEKVVDRFVDEASAIQLQQISPEEEVFWYAEE